MGYKVVNAIHVPGLDFGEDLLPEHEATLVKGDWRTEDELIANCNNADGIICSAPLQPFSRRVLSSLPRCRIVASIGIAYDRIDLEAATENGIVATNVPDYCLDEVSGRAIAFMFALGHRLFQLDKAVKGNQSLFVPLNRKAIADSAYPIYRMRGQTLGIVGLGKIGTAAALKARGFGTRVIAYDPYVLEATMRIFGVERVDFDTLLKESDFIAIFTALSGETRACSAMNSSKR